MKTVFRKDRFGEKQPNCSLMELINNKNEIRPLLVNPYKNQDKSELLFMRNVFEITKYACILESDTPIVSKNDGGYLKQVEQQVTKKQGDIRYILELRPNINALIDMALAVGFSSVSVVEPPESATCPYLKRGTKSIIVCRR